MQTVDYITPVVNDPYVFGAVAAANALSDIYAMGATPLFALNLVGFPPHSLPLGLLGEILRGGADKAAEAGVSVLGGHSIEDNEPKYGMCVTGTVHPARLVANTGARPGDALVLTKPLGLGVITTAIDRGMASSTVSGEAIEIMTALNKGAAEAMVQVGVHACTDVTGFGLLGHLRGLAGASDVGARIHAERVPVLAGAWDLARQGVIPAGSRNNRQFATDFVTWGPEVAQETQAILTDAQTSGGLLIAVPGERKAALLAALKAVDAPVAAEIGEIVEDGEGRVRVE